MNTDTMNQVYVVGGLDPSDLTVTEIVIGPLLAPGVLAALWRTHVREYNADMSAGHIRTGDSAAVRVARALIRDHGYKVAHWAWL